MPATAHPAAHAFPDVVIVTYGCHVLSTDPPLVSNEHKKASLFTLGEIPDLGPDGSQFRDRRLGLTGARQQLGDHESGLHDLDRLVRVPCR